MPAWELFARNPFRDQLAQVDDFAGCEAIVRFNAVGSWVLSGLPATSDAAVVLLEEGSGLVITRDGTTFLSGPVADLERVSVADSDVVQVAGVDDLVLLADRLASPEPATLAPPYATSAYDVRTGVGSSVLRQYVDVNAGPGAIAARRTAGLTLAADPGLGGSVTGRARWQPLTEILSELALAAGGLGFRVRQSGSDLPFTVYQPTDRSAEVVLGYDFGSLRAFRHSVKRPGANYVVTGGGGEGIARTVREREDGESRARWGRIERFLDQRHTSDALELDQALDEELARSASATGLSIETIDTANLVYGDDYDLGDKVRVMIGESAIDEIVREVRLTLDPSGAVVTPAIGTPSPSAVLGTFDALRDLAKRTRSLERS